MKKSALILAACVAFAFTSCKENTTDAADGADVAASAGTNEAASTSEAGDEAKFPVMTFEKIEHDFGTIDQGTAVEHLFTFKNTGTE